MRWTALGGGWAGTQRESETARTGVCGACRGSFSAGRLAVFTFRDERLIFRSFRAIGE